MPKNQPLENPDSLLAIVDDLSNTKDLVTAAFMAAGNLPFTEANPLQALLYLVEERLDNLGMRLDAMRPPVLSAVA